MPGSADATVRSSAVSGGIARALAALLAFVVGDVLRIRRAHAEECMMRAGIVDAAGTSRAMYRSLGKGLVELLATVFSPPERRLAADFPWAEIERIAAGPRGAVIATAHTGSWDVVACAVASRTPLSVVTKRLSVRFFDGVWQRLRARRGLRLIEAGTAARAASRALARGELVAMMVDQAPERERGVARVQFLGAPAWVDLAPALCALRARAPLVVAFPRRRGDGTHTVEIAGVFTPPPSARRAWVVETMSDVTRLLDAFVRRNPEQWLWMHRRWKDAGPRSPGSRAPRLAGARP